jgi:hypothetical protein
MMRPFALTSLRPPVALGLLAPLAAALLAPGCGSGGSSGFFGDAGLDGAGDGAGGSGGAAGAAGAAGGGAAGGGAGGAAGEAGTSGAGAAGTGGEGGAPPECEGGSDCDPASVCIGGQCEPETGCETSLDCALGLVCDDASGHCVECTVTADCGDSEACIDAVCVPVTACTSDVQCTPLGKLCDKQQGICVECLDHGGCDDAEHCAQGFCKNDVCAAGQQGCDQNQIVTCSAIGDGWEAPVACGSTQTCVSTAQGTSCADWICTPNQSACNGNVQETCAPDGLGVGSSVDCAQSGQVCVGDHCESLVCQPNEQYCDGDEARQCAANGQSSSLLDTCGSGEYCDDSGASASCKPWICTPNQPACDGDVATICNAAGSGYQAGGTDCGASGQSCSNGQCVACPGGSGAVDSVRLVEISIGATDYAILENTHASCGANLVGMQIRLFTAGTSTTNDVTFTLPSHPLAPGARVVVVQDTGGAGEIGVGSNIWWDPGAGGYALLCKSACVTSPTPNVLDAVSYSGTSYPPEAFPSPVSFSPSPLTGVTASNQETTAYKRVAFAGAYSTYLASDWTTGAPTRSAGASCPGTQPANGSSCTSNLSGLSCVYGAVTCTCSGDIFSGYDWSCS